VRAGAGSGIAAVRSGFARVANRARGHRREVATEPLFRRSVSRTSVLEDVLAELLYGHRTIDVTARTVDVVINACELRSGTAFRFGSTESWSSRFGRLARNDLPVAHAVAASAAYPVFLPAFDETFEFVGWDGATSWERVLLTDGGVYDNLGTTCLEPGRSSYHSTNVHPVDYIVSCDAGRGMLDIDTYPQWWAPRMKRSFESVYRKVQDAEKGNLHDHRRAGLIRGFVMPFLGMQDQNLPLQPPDLITRDQVIGYPTDFSPMPEEMLGLLTARGEQLTRLLIEHHCPEIA
jgi:NTE family protein